MFPTNLLAYNDNCWEWVVQRIGKVIPTAQLIADTRIPEVGSVAIMEYQKKDGSKIPHYAVVEGVFEGDKFLISECNMDYLYKDGCGYRILSTDYVYLKGFKSNK